MALIQAKKAFNKKEVPVGAIVFNKDRIISRAHNMIISKNDPLAHAEYIAIKKAAEQLHHSSNVSKKSYMNNEIVDLYIENPLKFKHIVESFRKKNGNLPTINRLLNQILYHLS